jgi:hypothetical protein
MPAAVLLFSPMTDLTVTGSSYAGKANVDPTISARAIRTRAADYLAGTDPADPLVSPIFAAVATGTEELNYCVPSCTTHKSTYYPVSIQVDGDLAVSGKPDTYIDMTISYASASAMPAISNAETGGVITQRQSNSWTEKLPISGGWTGKIS